MARFMGTVQGSRGEASRLGHGQLVGRVNGWDCGVTVNAATKDDKENEFLVFVTGGSRGRRPTTMIADITQDTEGPRITLYHPETGEILYPSNPQANPGTPSTPFTPTHLVYHEGPEGYPPTLVMLVEDGWIVTEEGHKIDANSSYERHKDGSWTYEGAPFPGRVVPIASITALREIRSMAASIHGGVGGPDPVQVLRAIEQAAIDALGGFDL